MAFVEFNDDLIAYFVTLFAEIITALERSDAERLLGVACSGIQFLEQRALDGQAWILRGSARFSRTPSSSPRSPRHQAKGGQRAKQQAEQDVSASRVRSKTTY